MKTSYPIDFVIPWVDGNDPAWQEEKAKYSGKTGDTRSARFRDWETLPYWFRGVEKFAPWVNKIHFIACINYSLASILYKRKKEIS